MSDTTTAPETAAGTTGMPAERQERFARDLDAVGHRTGRGDRRVVLASAAVMAAGVALTVIAYFTSTGQSDTRDVISSGILAMVGLALVLAGGAVFVRSSMTEFLRFWMLRLIYEQQRGDDG
jgi:hypothetical protein